MLPNRAVEDGERRTVAPRAGMPASASPGDRAPGSARRGGLEIPGTLWIDEDARRAFVGGDELPLTTQLFDLLAFFMSRRGTAVSFEELASEVWSYPYGAGDHHFLHTAVYRLRRILLNGGVDNLVEGIRGFGYRVSARAQADASSIETMRTVGRPIAVFDPLDPDLRFSMVNEAALQLTGYEIEVITNLPRAARRLWTPGERAFVDLAVGDALASGTATTWGRELLRADGETVIVDLFFSRLEVANGNPLCVAEARESHR